MDLQTRPIHAHRPTPRTAATPTPPRPEPEPVVRPDARVIARLRTRTGWRSALLATATLIVVQAGLPGAAHADRFGPPFMDRVTAATASVYTNPDRSQTVGSLPKDAIVVVLNQQNDMIQIPDGWIATSDVAESIAPWVAEAAQPSASIYAYPDLTSPVRRTVSQGDLLRVTGVSYSVGSDSNIYWATTEGYLLLPTLRQATGDVARGWSMPSPDLAPGGWWGRARAANVRAAPSTDAPVVGEFAGGELIKVLDSQDGDPVADSATWYRIDGGRYAGGFVHSSLISRAPAPAPTVLPPPPDMDLGDRPWIVVNRPAHTLTLLANGAPQFVTYVSLGKAGQETPEGDYFTWGKYTADRMSNAANPDADHAYNLPNVPFVQYYKDGGYGIHGTYWHDQFGTNESQGCVNLTITDAAYLFGRTLPRLPDGTLNLVASQAPDHASTPLEIIGGS